MDTQEVNFAGLTHEAYSREDGPALMEAVNIMKALGKLVDDQLAWEKDNDRKMGGGQYK